MGFADSLRSARQPALSGELRRGIFDLCGPCGPLGEESEADAAPSRYNAVDLAADRVDKFVASFCHAVPKLRVLPTEAELAAFWDGCDRLDQAQLCLAIRQHLARSAEGPWQLQARILRVLISAFGRQPRGRALATSALAGGGEGLVRQLTASEVPEVCEEAAKLVQLLELSRSLPAGESLRDVAKRGGLLSFTTAAAAPAAGPAAVAKPQAAAPPAKGPVKVPKPPTPDPSVDLLDLSPRRFLEPAAVQAPAAAKAPVDAGRETGPGVPATKRTPPGSDISISQLQDLVFAPAPERYHLGDREAECGNQELEQMYSFVLRPRAAIPYLPPREAKVASKSNDPFEFVSEHVRQMTVA